MRVNRDHRNANYTKHEHKNVICCPTPEIPLFQKPTVPNLRLKQHKIIRDELVVEEQQSAQHDNITHQKVHMEQEINGKDAKK